MLISSLFETAARYIIQIIAPDQNPQNQQAFYQSFQQKFWWKYIRKIVSFTQPELTKTSPFVTKKTTSFSPLIWIKNVHSAYFLAQVFSGGVYLLILPERHRKKFEEVVLCFDFAQNTGLLTHFYRSPVDSEYVSPSYCKMHKRMLVALPTPKHIYWRTFLVSGIQGYTIYRLYGQAKWVVHYRNSLYLIGE